MTNEYDDLLASDGAKDEARTNLRASVLAALPANPDQVAEAKRLSKTTGLPAPVVERNLDKVKQQATLNEYDGLIERAPVTASKMQDRQFAKVAHPERDQLAELEEFIKRSPGQQDTSTGAALKRGTAMLGQIGEAMGYGLDRALTAIGKRFLPEPAIPGGEIDATGSQAKASLIQVANLYSSLPRDKRIEFAGELANRAAAEGETLRGMGDAMAYIARNPGAALNYLTEMAPSAAAGGGVGGLAARPLAAAAAQRVVARSAAAGVVTPGAAAASQAVSRGVTSAAVTGAGTAVNAFPAELAGQISGGAEVDDALAYAGKKATVEGGVNAVFGFAAGMLPLGSTLLGRTGNILGQAGLQGAGGATGAAAAAASVGEDITPGEMFLEAFFEVATAPVDIAIAAATSVAEQRDATKAQADKATASADYLNKIMAAAAASKTRTRDPETFAQLVQDAAESSGTAPTEVFIDAQPLVDTLQKAGMTEAQIREMLPSVAEQLGAEYATGGTVAIPIGELVTAFSGAGVEAELVKFLRTSPDGFSVADSEQALAQLEEMDADAQRIIAEQQDADAWEMSAKVVEDTLFAQFEGSGRWSSDVNRVLATVARNFFVTQADAVGVTPDELYRQFPLTVSGVAPTGQVLSQPGGAPRVIYRGTNNSGERIVGGIAEGALFAAADEDVARSYAGTDGSVERIAVMPDARVLVEGSAEFAKVTGRRRGKLINTMRKGENLKTAADDVAAKARVAGYDAVEFTSMRDLGIAIFNEAKFIRNYTPAASPTTFDQEANGTTPYAADTIEVDGKPRPAVNAKGQRIAQSEEGLRNFWRWFGDSKVVDEQGRPLVVYHGTSATTLEEFDDSMSGSSMGSESGLDGFYFTADPETAGLYAKASEKSQHQLFGRFYNRQNILPVYLSAQSPMVYKKQRGDQITLMDTVKRRVIAEAKQGGHDAVIFQGFRDTPTGRGASVADVFVAFTPTQIKSATGNRGTFNPADPNILNQEGGYTDEMLEFLIAEGSMSRAEADTIKATAKARGQNADPRTAGAGGRAQPGTGAAGRPSGQGAVRTAAGTAPRSGWETATAVRGADGKPRTVYRGGRTGRVTAANFDPSAFGKATGYPLAGLGVFFTTWSSDAQKYANEVGGRVGEFKLDIRNPRVIRADQLPEPSTVEEAVAFREALRAKGYDGIAIDYREVGGPVQLVAFDPEQVILPEEALYQEGAPHPFAGFTREQFLGNPKITSDANGATLQPRVLTTVEPAEAEPFAAGKGLTAKYSPDGAAVFDGDKVIASYNFGDTLVVDKKYRRQGIAEELVYQWRMRNPQAQPARERTRKSQALQEKVWERIEREMSGQGDQGNVWAPDTDLIAAAKEVFGVTTDPNEAGYVLPDGTMLDFTGRHYAGKDNWRYMRGERAVDHRELATENIHNGKSLSGMLQATGSEGMYEFMARTGAMRMDARAGVASVSRPPTPKQIAVIGNARKGDFVALSFNRPDGEIVVDTEIDSASPMKVRKFFDEATQREGGTGVLAQDAPAKAQPEKQGSFNPATLNIALLEKADLSTALHELGHFFFEMQATIAARPDAPARIAEDVATLLKTVGFEGTAAEWLAQPLNDRREAHEQVAETFEQYLLTGKAPSLELQGLFNRMRAWMLSVYKTLKRFFAIRNRAGLSPEVSAVFDRMLATDAAIAEAKRVRAMTPLFKSAEEAGMDPEAWAAYQQAAGQVDEDAIRDLDARQVRDMKWLRSARSKALKALQADASAKRREARIEARRRLLQEPVYRAMQFLRGKVEQAPVEKKSKGLDTRRDDLLTAIAKLGGINKEMAVAEWGIDPKDFATSPVFGSPILRGGKSGRSPDGMAEALAEVGYLMPKDGARYVLTDLEDMLADSARGISHYSLDADYDLIHGYKTLPAPADLGEQPFAAGRLSRPDLEARFAGSDVEWQKLGIGRRGMIAEMGMDADAVANIVGFNTGEEMVKALLAAEALQDATEALTDQIMLERHGDITSPEGLQRAADEALANDAHAKMLATEYARLDKAVGSPRAVERAAREAALRTVDRQAVRLARPDKATAAAARAGKAAQKAHAAGNLEEAAGVKRNQILNTAIARAQRELRTFVEKAQGDFAKMFGKDAQLAKTRDMNLVNLARAALAQYGLAPEAGGMKALQYLNLVKQYDPALAANLESMLEAMPEGKDFRELTGGEFRTVADLVRGMWEMSRGVKQITIDGKKVELDLVADELVEAVRANNGGETGTLPGHSGTTTKVDDLRVGALGIKSMLTRVEQWADAMGPAFKRYVWQPVSEAVTRYRTRRNEMVGQYRDLLKTIESGLTYHKIHAPELGLGGFTFNGGKSEVLHAVLHSGNESNLRKLLLGRGWAVQDEEGNVDASKWQEFVQRMVDDGVLTREDFDFVQGVWDLLETVKADAQKAHRELYGYYFNEVTATPFIDPFGVERRGGYVPAIADGLSSPDAMQKREQEELLHAGNSFMFPSTGKGFTQARVEYNRPLELDLRTIASHLDKVTRFAYIEPAVRDVGKILLNKRVSRALNGYDQTIISSMLNPWLQRAARQTVSKPGMNRYADKFFNALRTRSGVVIMFANVVNTLQQLTGFSVAALKVPAPKLLRATYRMMANPKQMSAEAAALSPWLADRMSGQSFEMQQQIENILLNTNAVAKGNEFLVRNAYFMQQAMQNAMDPIIWWGAYDHAIEQGLSQQDAVRAADSAVRTTQGTFAPEDVAAFESNTAFVRLFTQFYGYFNMLGNTIGAEAKKAIRDMGYGAATPRLLFIWFAGLALPAVVGEIIARGLPDDEDDEDGDGLLDEYMALFFGTQGRTLAAMAPGLGQGVTLAFNMTDDKVYNDRLSISPGLSMAETTVRGGVTLLQGEMFDERLTKTEVRDFFTLIGMAVGAPTGPLARAGGYMADVENGRADPESTPELVKGLVVGR